MSFIFTLICSIMQESNIMPYLKIKMKGCEGVNSGQVDPKLSVVIPVYQEESHIRSSIAMIEAVLLESKISYEIVLVDDGSKDKTWQELEKMAVDNERITAIRLSRNFGKESALCAGLENASGEGVLVMAILA